MLLSNLIPYSTNLYSVHKTFVLYSLNFLYSLLLLLSYNVKLTPNTKLRDDYKSLDLLCDDLQLDKAELEAKLSAIDYNYDLGLNKFI